MFSLAKVSLYTIILSHVINIIIITFSIIPYSSIDLRNGVNKVATFTSYLCHCDLDEVVICIITILWFYFYLVVVLDLEQDIVTSSTENTATTKLLPPQLQVR